MSCRMTYHRNNLHFRLQYLKLLESLVSIIVRLTKEPYWLVPLSQSSYHLPTHTSTHSLSVVHTHTTASQLCNTAMLCFAKLFESTAKLGHKPTSLSNISARQDEAWVQLHNNMYTHTHTHTNCFNGLSK